MGRLIVDEEEFFDIIRGRLRNDLKKLLEKGAITFLGPGKGISIPIREIRIPQLRFKPIPKDADAGGDTPDIGIGQGPEKPGDIVGHSDYGYCDDCEDDDGGSGQGPAKKSAGSGRGEDILEIEVPETEFRDLLRDVLKLPHLKPKGGDQIQTKQYKYTGVKKSGPDSLNITRRMLKNAIKRQLLEGKYDPKDPSIIPISDDKRFRSPRPIEKPQANAVIFYMMDVSASMSEDEREIVRYYCKLFQIWLRGEYDGVKEEFIIHNGEADSVSEDEFYSTQRAGGTVISSAHQLMLDIIREKYPPAQWNIYPLYFSDGFNFSEDDLKCKELLVSKILPIVNQYTYGEVSSWRWEEFKDQQLAMNFSLPGTYGKMLTELKVSNLNKYPLEIVFLHRKEDVPEAIRRTFRNAR